MIEITPYRKQVKFQPFLRFYAVRLLQPSRQQLYYRFQPFLRFYASEIEENASEEMEVSTLLEILLF